ncbi:MAG: AtpZ/AtpI family protein [Bacteroidota bacterium]
MSISNRNSNQRKKQLNDYARYSAIGIQIAVFIFACTYGGVKLDEWLGLKVPVFTLLLSLLSVVMSMVFFFKSFKNDK